MIEVRKTKRRTSKRLPRYLAPIVNRLKEARLRKNLPQSELEHKIGLGEGYLSKWETGERRPNLFNLMCWASALELQIGVVPMQEYVSNDNGELIANDNSYTSKEAPMESPHNL